MRQEFLYLSGSCIFRKNIFMKSISSFFAAALLLISLSTFGQDTIPVTDSDVTRNVLSIFPTKATKINGFCLAFSHNKPRKINGLNIEFPGARFTEYFIFFLSRRIYP